MSLTELRSERAIRFRYRQHSSDCVQSEDLLPSIYHHQISSRPSPQPTSLPPPESPTPSPISCHNKDHTRKSSFEAIIDHTLLTPHDIFHSTHQPKVELSSSTQDYCSVPMRAFGSSASPELPFQHTDAISSRVEVEEGERYRNKQVKSKRTSTIPISRGKTTSV